MLMMLVQPSMPTEIHPPVWESPNRLFPADYRQPNAWSQYLKGSRQALQEGRYGSRATNWLPITAEALSLDPAVPAGISPKTVGRPIQ